MAATLPALAQIGVQINGNSVVFQDAQPKMQDGRVLVPLRAVLEAMRIDVGFDPDTNVITAENDGKTVKLRLNSREATVNGRLVYLDVPAQAVNGRTFIPLRFFGEAFGAEVKWRGYDEQVLIAYSPGSSTSPTDPPNTGDRPVVQSLTHNAVNWLSSGQSVIFTLRAESGLPATLLLDSGKLEIPFREVRTGEYEARYQVPFTRDSKVNFQDTSAVAIVGNRNNQAAIKTNLPLRVDNVAPVIIDLQPTDQLKVLQARPSISASLSDEGGSGVDPRNVTIRLNDTDVTRQATITDRLLVWKPRSDLKPGNYRIQITIEDQAGNATQQDSRFEVVSAQSLVKNVTVTAPQQLEPGDRIRFNVPTEPSIERVWVNLGSSSALVSLRKSKEAEFVTEYTVAKGDSFDETPVRIIVEDKQGNRFEYESERTLTSAGLTTAKPTIETPGADTKLADQFIVSGSAEKAERVVIKVEYRASLFGLLETTGLVYEGEVEVNEDGTYKTEAIDARGLLQSNASEYIITVTSVSKSGRKSQPTVRRLKA